MTRACDQSEVYHDNAIECVSYTIMIYCSMSIVFLWFKGCITIKQLALFHCMVRYGSVRLGTVRLSSGRFAFPPQFSTAIEWAGLFTRRYNCAASTAVTSS